MLEKVVCAYCNTEQDEFVTGSKGPKCEKCCECSGCGIIGCYGGCLTMDCPEPEDFEEQHWCCVCDVVRVEEGGDACLPCKADLEANPQSEVPAFECPHCGSDWLEGIPPGVFCGKCGR